MCLSTVYKNKMSDDNIIMKNVMSIEFIKGSIVLTDLMERKCTVDGTLEVANLVDGYVIIKTK